jgi:predicted translation initiation factor SUI1
MTARLQSGDVVAFLGPSLAPAAARRVAPCRVLPPARAGDVLAVLPQRPLAIALVDGLFDTSPSVWHRELLAALDAGVAVFGGGSMGALRAAELGRHGVVGVGRIAAWFRDGVLVDDGEVALLHAGPEHGFRSFTLPLVQVRAAAAAARDARLASAREAGAIVAAGTALGYPDRTWPAVLARAALPAASRARLAAFLPTVPDLKAEDARATIAAAAEYARARRAGAPPPPRPDVPPAPSHLRRARLRHARTDVPGGAAIPSGAVLAALARRPDAGRLAADGLRRALVVALARSLGLAATAAETAASERAFLARAGVPPRGRAAFLGALGLDDAAARTLAEDLALEAKVLADAPRIVPDGPSFEEGLALAARLGGAWVEEALGIGEAMKKKPPPSQPAGPFNPALAALKARLPDGYAPPEPAAARPAPKKAERVPARAVVRMERKGRGGKEATVVEKLDLDARTLAAWADALKRALGCGGGVEDGGIVVQGDQRDRVVGWLEARGVRKISVG